MLRTDLLYFARKYGNIRVREQFILIVACQLLSDPNGTYLSKARTRRHGEERSNLLKGNAKVRRIAAQPLAMMRFCVCWCLSERHYVLTPFGQCSELLNTAGIAQLVEQLIRNEKVGGSIPLSGTNKNKKLCIF